MENKRRKEVIWWSFQRFQKKEENRGQEGWKKTMLQSISRSHRSISCHSSSLFYQSIENEANFDLYWSKAEQELRVQECVLSEERHDERREGDL